MNVRSTTDADEQVIRQLHEAAFGPEEGRTIAELVVALLHDPTAKPFVSLLAYAGSVPIGHVLFTRVWIEGAERSPAAHILAPLAILPDCQRKGTGTQLVRAGLEGLAESGCELVFVLGHPEYYPRFGFQPAGELGFSAPYPILEKNANAWMVLELSSGIVGGVRGVVRCAEALDKPKYWCE